ncbi:MAG: methyltransferase [Clostridiales bacterium]|nr:methyltransferase [Clostridiales bacterium]
MINYERLSDEIYIEVSSEHTFGTDALLLADFANPRKRDTALDMGTGCGIIPFLWLRENPPENLHCLDIQENAFEQVKRSIKRNNLAGKLVPHHCDLRKIKGEFPAEMFSLVTMNPPYKPVGTGIESLNESAKIARHEICCNIEDAVSAAAYLLKFGGRFCMCHRPERLVDAIEIMRGYKLEPKRLRFVSDKAGEEPFLFLIEGMKNSKPFLRVMPTLFIKKENGKFTDEMIKIYGSYADGYDK